ncbi:MAG: hypothetical protein AAB581_03330 [Patescibacteria group bacterium]
MKTQEEIQSDLVAILESHGDVKGYIASLIDPLPYTTPEEKASKNRKAAAAIMAYGSFERGLFNVDMLAEILHRTINP